jgi:hypothetical protein
MPWCDECDELVEEEDLTEDDACPRCGTVLLEPAHRHVPWYFKVMLVASVVYLGYRGYQGISWIAQHV